MTNAELKDNLFKHADSTLLLMLNELKAIQAMGNDVPVYSFGNLLMTIGSVAGMLVSLRLLADCGEDDTHISRIDAAGQLVTIAAQIIEKKVEKGLSDNE